MTPTRKFNIPINLGTSALVLGGMTMAFAAGLLAPVLPWWLSLVFFAPPFLIALGWHWPTFAVLGTLLVVYGVVPLGRPKAIDLVVALFILFIAVVRRQYIAEVLGRFKSLWLLLGLFLVYVAFATAYSKGVRLNPTDYIYAEMASMLYWLALFPAALIARDEKSAEVLLKTLVVVAVIICAVSVAQSLLGMRLLFSGDNRVAEMDAASGGISGIARSTVPGTPLVVFSFLLAVATLSRRAGTTWVWVVVLMLTGAALFVSFGRALWAMTFVGSFLVAALSGWRAFLRMLVFSTIFIALAVAVAYLVKPDLITGVVNRILSVRAEGGTQSSFGWRITENSYAIPHILRNLWLGIGLGAEYKPRLVDIRAFSEQTRYIHNGYLYVLLKMGIVGLAAYLLMVLHLLYRCFQGGRLLEPAYTARAALGVLLLMTLALNVTQPELFAGPTIISLAVLAPVVLSTRLKWT